MAVVDLGISGTQQAQSIARYYFYPNVPTPEPTIMVGQQVQLDVPLTGLTNVTWHFPSTTDVIGDYALKDGASGAIAMVSSPSPPQPTSNPMTIYWITSSNSGVTSKNVYVTANYPGVNGPLVSDVYYTVATPIPSVTTMTGATDTTQYPNENSSDQFDCSSTYFALSAGNPCNTRGIVWNYSVSNVPSYGNGTIAMVQIVNQLTEQGMQASPSPAPVSNGGGTGLDTKFPYISPTPSSQTWTSSDSPSMALALPPVCSSDTFSGKFTDYFMYEPTTPTGRTGSNIWVTLAEQSWTFSGTVKSSKGTYALQSGAQNPTFTNIATDQPFWNAIFNNYIPTC